ncbi:MAG: molybdate ABC transporter substrate-binding protein [Chitinophagales bacterium]|nr:molybdate ABC transporter substrate-binding protein [Chitinophagales bacterium]
MDKHFTSLNRFSSLFVILLLLSCNNASQKQEASNPSIMIAVAANMQFAMNELIRGFTEETGVKCEMTISSSGKLTAQIKQGAPFDVFVSANMIYPNEIFKSGMAAGPPKVYARGKLVLWTMKEGLTPSINTLNSESIQHIALANPKTAPYGVAAIELLKKNQLLEELKHKLVYGESIAQTNQFIIAKSAEMGFTAMSVVVSSELKGKGKWIEIESDWYSPIEQGVVVIERDRSSTEKGKQFYDYLSSEKAKEILSNYGYEVL